ncbi:hypothetical protein BH23PLA1_BH23PLA1_18550 [soil metagenome]
MPNLPDLGSTPLGRSLDPVDAAGLTFLSLAFDSVLNNVLDDIVASRGLRIDRLDVFGLLEQAMADPSAFDLVDVTNPAFQRATGTVVDNPEGYLFWDDVHPTARAHALLGQAAITAVPEPTAAVLASLGLLMIGGAIRRSRRRFD